MLVEHATTEDLPAIRAAYAHGARIQRENETSSWPEFDDTFLASEIAAARLLRVMDGGVMAGVFCVAYEDPAIWGERERGAHVYLHRITRSPAFGGRGMFDAVLSWADARCRALGREGLRMDTWATNTKLVHYYEQKGFTLVGVRRMPADPRLAPHYHGIDLALLEKPCAYNFPRSTPV